MVTNVELYEALKPTIGEQAAKMIAEVVPPTRDLATRTDLAQLETKIQAETTRTIKWIVGVMVPMFVGTWGTTIAVLLRT